MKVAVIGMGKTGLPMAVALLRRGCTVTGVEISEPRLRELADPNWEPAEPHCGWEGRKELTLTSDLDSAVRSTDLALMIVQTPETEPLSGVIDVGPTERAAGQIGKALRDRPDRPYTVVMSSTVMPGTCRRIIAPRVGPSCSVLFNPVWIALGSVVEDYLNPPVLMLGTDGEMSPTALEFSRTVFANTSPIITDTITAEASKLVYNVWCTLKMAFVNEAARVYAAAGGDSSVVEGFFKNGGERPGAFLRPGPPPGGPCFPRDLRFAHQMTQGDSCFSAMVTAVDSSNDLALRRIIEEVKGYQAGRRVGIIGLTYKPGVPVVEETVSYLLTKLLLNLDYEVVAYDPLVTWGAPAGVELAKSLEECIESSDILVEMHIGTVPDDVGIPVVRPWR